MKPLNILLADDTKSVGHFVSEYLREAGHQVTYVQSGEEAVEAYKQQPFDLVLMDVVMPGMGGLAAVKQIKAIPSAIWVPIIVITGLDAEEDILGAFLAGADDYMVKPLKPITLDIRIRAMMRIAAIQRSSTAVIDSVIEGIIQINGAGRISRFNKAAESIFGYAEAEVLGKNVNMLMPAPYKEEHDDYLAHYAETRQAKVIGIGRIVTGLRKNGETFAMHLGVTEAATPEGKFFVGLVRDISEHEAARANAEALAQLNAERERFIHTITDAIPGMVSYWDHTLLCRFANNRYLEWFGKSPEELIDIVTIRELMGEPLFAVNEPHIRGALAGVNQHFARTLTKPDGTVAHAWTSYVPDIDSAGRVVGFFVLVTDVTPLKEAEAALELAASVYRNTDDGITVTDANGAILSVNPAFTRITGYPAEEVIGENPRILKSNRHDQAFYAAMWQDINAKGRWEGELWNRRKNGDIYPERMVITAIRDAAGEAHRYVSVFNDITALWRKDEHVRHLAFHDALTDLPNRTLLLERLDRQIAMSAREHRELAVMFLDLDGFKLVNDTLGHEVGDDVLKTVAQRLLTIVRQADTVARLGGDEFVIILDNPANRDEVAHIASRIIATVGEPMNLQPRTAQVSTSIGIAMLPADGETPADLIKNADTAMYAAKMSGKKIFRFFDATMTAHLR